MAFSAAVVAAEEREEGNDIKLKEHKILHVTVERPTERVQGVFLLFHDFMLMSLEKTESVLLSAH